MGHSRGFGAIGVMDMLYESRGERREMKRDGELVDWLARLGACEVRHVQERYGISRSVA